MEKEILEKYENISDEDLGSLCNILPKGKDIDYTIQGWGHAITFHNNIGKHCAYISGFLSKLKGGIEKGDRIIFESSKGKMCKAIILEVNKLSNPSDMYYAIVVEIEVDDNGNEV